MFRLRYVALLILIPVLLPGTALAVTAGVEDARSIARLYVAAFDRDPKIPGLNFWIDSYESGESLVDIAAGFYESPEFTARYGLLTDPQYVERLYQNVLGRPGLQEGVDYWTGLLADGVSRANILASFAGSAENISKTAARFADMHAVNCHWYLGPVEPATTKTGYLVGPTTSGVSYKTPTLECVTGPDGSFQYEEGETIQFTVGDTLLGAVTGRVQVTPFDLAGSPVVTGLGITWALQDEADPFQTVINIAALLHSLDSDGNPANGIQIDADTTLVRGLNLDLDQGWESFQAEPTLHRAAGAVVRPEVALEQLYGALAIDPLTVGVNLLQPQGDNTGDIEESWQYDSNGNVTRHEGIGLGFETWQYDANGLPLRQDRNAEIGNQYDSVETWQYDANGNVTGHEEYNGGASQPARTFQYQYDIYGNLTREEKYEDGDSKPVTIRNRQYDASGNLRQFKEEWYTQGKPLLFESWEYDADGNVTRREHRDQTAGNPVFNDIETWQYDDSGNVVRHELDSDQFSDLIETWHYEYDADGNVTRKEHVSDDTDSPGGIETWQYDALGRVTRNECDGDCEGGPSLPSADYRLETWQYHANGTVMRHTVDTNWQFEDLGNVHDIVVAIRYEYDANGNLVREENGGDSFFPPNNVTNYTYDASGNLTRVEIVDDASLQSVETRQYDDRGNLLRRETDGVDDRLPDSISDSVEIWQYNEAGHLVQKERDENGDGFFEQMTSYRYEATGWGHLFSGIDMYGHDYAPPQNPKTEFDRD